MNYLFIISPNNKKKFSIFKSSGKSILKKYLKQLLGGSELAKLLKKAEESSPTTPASPRAAELLARTPASPTAAEKVNLRYGKRLPVDNNLSSAELNERAISDDIRKRDRHRLMKKILESKDTRQRRLDMLQQLQGEGEYNEDDGYEKKFTIYTTGILNASFVYNNSSQKFMWLSEGGILDTILDAIGTDYTDIEIIHYDIPPHSRATIAVEEPGAGALAETVRAQSINPDDAAAASPREPARMADARRDETLRAAIICQRKFDEKNAKVQTTSNLIERIIRKIVKKPIKFVYITEGEGEETKGIDLKITIDDKTKTDKTGEFDIIVLNTCPLGFDETRKGIFAWIEKSLKNKGKVYLTAGNYRGINDFSDRIDRQEFKADLLADLLACGFNYTNNTNEYNLREITRMKDEVETYIQVLLDNEKLKSSSSIKIKSTFNKEYFPKELEISNPHILIDFANDSTNSEDPSDQGYDNSFLKKFNYINFRPDKWDKLKEILFLGKRKLFNISGDNKVNLDPEVAAARVLRSLGAEQRLNRECDKEKCVISGGGL